MTRLVLDVGNTKTSIGIFSDDNLIRQWRIRTEHWTSDELQLKIAGFLNLGNLERPDRMGYACVVPQVRHSLNGLARQYLGVEPVDINPSTCGLKITYPNPEELGADRLANVVAVVKLGPCPAIIVDFGTATTFDLIDNDCRYLGGAISPGVGTAAGELFKKAERIHPVDLEFPESHLGFSTKDAVRSGVLFAAVGATDHMIENLSVLVSGNPSLWATGGWAAGIVPRCRHGFQIVPELTLLGINEVCRKNEEKS